MIRAALPKKYGGLDLNVLFITTVQSLSHRRLDQLLSSLDINKIELDKLTNKFYVQTLMAQDVEKFLSTLESYITSNKIGMVIIDPITGLSDVQFIKDETNEVDYIGRAQFLKRILPIFKEIIFKYQLFFVVTNNMTSNVSTGKNIPNLGSIWENGINTRIVLMRNYDKERVMQICFSNFMDKQEAEYVIDDGGIYITKILN